MHRMWEPRGKSQLEIANDSILALKEILKEQRVILVSDSWYPPRSAAAIAAEVVRIRLRLHLPRQQGHVQHEAGPNRKAWRPREERQADQDRGFRSPSEPVCRSQAGADLAVWMGPASDRRSDRPGMGPSNKR